MSGLLETRCDLCGSWMWCGRACSHDPRKEPDPEPMNGVSVSIVSTVSKLTKADLAIDKVAKRKAYQRELMRERRAKAKAAKASALA